MSAVDDYVSDLMATLRVSKRHRVRIEGEIRDHLDEAIAGRFAAGAGSVSAAQQAIASFGPAALLAAQFNAEAGRRAMRLAPVLVGASGTVVVVGFLFAATTQPATHARAHVVSQISFFGAVIALQIAVVAGMCAMARVAPLWRSPAVRAANRRYVRRCAGLSAAALVVAAISWSVTFTVAFITSARPNGVTFAVGATAMIVAASASCASLATLRINDTDEPAELEIPATGVLTWGENLVVFLQRYPVLSCSAVTIFAAASAMVRAETTVMGALPWGVAQAAAVVAGYALLGPMLQLRLARSVRKVDFAQREQST